MSERVIEVASLSKTVEGSVVDSTEQTAEIMNKNINSQAVESNHVVEPVVLKLNESAIRFNDLDAYVRAEVPGLTFSFHVYSDTPVRRTIIINGRRVREGEWVEKQLLLEEITPKGVILIWNGLHRFSIDVVDGW